MSTPGILPNLPSPAGTMSTPGILFQPGVVSSLPNSLVEQQMVRYVQALGGEGAKWMRDDDDPSKSVFLARTPDEAVTWVFANAANQSDFASVRKRLALTEEEDDEATASATKKPKHSHNSTSSNTRRANAAAEAKAKEVFASIWHNSQEAEADASREHAFTIERAQWLQYVGKQPETKGAGTTAVTEAIRRATTVGNAEAIRDFQLSLQHWRASHASPPASLSSPRAECQSLVPVETLRALRDGPASERVRYHYLRVEGAEQLGAGLGIARRFHAARLREAYNQRIACEVQPERVPPISRKRKAQIQAELYLAVRPRGSTKRGNRDFETFQRTLKHGKRWLALESSFGCGIFALLPKSRVSNTFVERTLTDELFAMWSRTLQACSPLVVRMARDITPLVALFADDRPPPARLRQLELLQKEVADTDGPTECLAELLVEVGEHSRIEEVLSDEELEEREAIDERGGLEEVSEVELEDDDLAADAGMGSEGGLFATQAEEDGVASSDLGSPDPRRMRDAVASEYEDDALSDEVLQTLL